MGLEEIAALGGLALAATGTGLGVASSVETKNAMNQKALQALAQQKQYQKQGSKLFDVSSAASTPQVAQAQQQAGTDRLQAELSKASAVPVGGPAPLVSPGGVVESGVNATNRLSNRAAAQYGGQNEWQLLQWIKNLRAEQQLGVLSDFARGSVGTLPLQLQQAQQSGAPLALAGTGASTAGNLAGLYGLYGNKAKSTPASIY